MIFVCAGSRGYQFDRLFQALDVLVAEKAITEELFAQTGNSGYIPLHYRYARYLDEESFRDWQEKADLIISHGGTGALVSALKRGKQVIAVPRRAEFGEHIDDHQLQVTGALARQGYLLEVTDMGDLLTAIHRIQENPIKKKFVLPSHIVEIIENYIDREVH